MKSPITGGTQLSINRQISAYYIVQSYLESYGIDVTRLLGERDSIEEYRCEESYLRFFGPSQLAGDSDFYAELQEFPWYYMDWKWEHQVVRHTVRQGDRILEIGCAKGAFIERMSDMAACTGLELNQAAAQEAQANGLDVRTETIQEHARSHAGQYDVVCSFQVMEHVTDVKDIIQASLDALRPGGRLVISVPNNDSFIKHSPNSILNMPPHHMNLWDETSLSKLEEFFDMELLGFKLEPLQKYHYAVVLNNLIETTLGKGVLGKVVKKVAKWTYAHRLVGLFSKKIKGHSIIAFYSKDS